MKVFIITEGGEHRGFGHITRCVSLFQAFEEKGLAPEIIIKGDESVEALFKKREYKNFDWLKEREKIFNMITGADIVIIDSYLADHKFYERVSKSVKIPVYFDDNKRLDYPRGMLVNGAIYAEELNYPQSKNITYLLGTRYIPLRREFFNAPKKKIRNSIESVIITFGGNDTNAMTEKVLMVLKDRYPQFFKSVIMGAGFQNLSDVENLNDGKTNFVYNPDVKKLKKIILESDIAISAGGQTLYELAKMGIPTIGVCVAENQRLNVEKWAEAGFLKFAGQHSDSDLLYKLNNCLSELLDKNERYDSSRNGMRKIDGRGAERIVREIFQKAFDAE